MSIYTEFNTFLNSVPDNVLTPEIRTLYLVRELEYWQFDDERPDDETALKIIQSINTLCDKYHIKVHEKLTYNKVPWNDVDWNDYHRYLVRNLWTKIQEDIKCFLEKYSVVMSN